MDEYDIHLRSLAADRDESPVAGLQRVFGVDETRASALVEALPRVVKRRVPENLLPRYAQALDELGAEFEFRRSAIVPTPIVAVVGGAASAEGELDYGLSLPPPPAEPRAAAPRYAATVVGRSGDFDLQRFVAGHERTEASPTPKFDRTEVSPPPKFDDPPELASQPFVPPPVAPLSVPPPVDTSRTLREAPPQSGAFGTAQRTQPLGSELSSWVPPPRESPRLQSARPPAREPAPLPQPRPTPHSARPPARPAQAPLSVRPDDRVYNVWAPLEPRETPLEPRGTPLGAPPAWPADPAPPAPAPPGPGPAPPQLDLDIGGRPAWLVDGRGALRGDALSQSLTELGGAPIDPWGAPLEPGPEPALDAPLRATPPSHAPGPASVPPAAMAQVQARPRPGHAVGVYTVPSRTVREPPAALRWLLRAGLGLSMFMVLAMFRHCRAFDNEVQEQLAGWGEQPALAEGAPSGSTDRPKTLGPPAADWLESDLNQVTNGDKDAVRAIVQRLLQAGALAVYMGEVTRSGPMQIAGEIVVALPKDPERRKRVLDEHQRYLDAAFSGLAGQRPDPGGDYLRITL